MYKRTVQNMMNPFIHMELSLKESQKYAKQGRNYTSTIMNLETLIWFVYEMEQDRTHRQLGIFAACEREILHTVQNVSAPLDRIKVISEKLQKINISQEKQEALKTAVQTGESAKRDVYYKFWDMRVEISEKARELLADAAESSPEKLKGACKELKLGESLHTLHDALRDSIGKLEKAVKEMESIELDLVPGNDSRKKVWEIMRFRDVAIESGDKEGVLFTALKECMKKVRDDYKSAEMAVEKAIVKYERIESRAAGKKKGEGEKKGEGRASVKKKIELLQMQQPERSSRVAEEKRKEMMR